MQLKKFFIPFVLLMIVSLMLGACGGGSTEEDVAVAVALTQTASALQIEPTDILPTGMPPTEPVPVGTISGAAYLVAPPTPAMTIFAVNIETGEWFSTTTEESELEVQYRIDVVPGTYEVFSHGLGYSYQDEWGLSKVTVVDGQTLVDIDVTIPTPTDCGPRFGTPAAPDGSFEASEQPDQDCVDFLLSGSAKAIDPDSATSDLMRIQFDPGATMAQIEGHIAQAMGGHHYILGAAEGQYMTVNLISDEDLTIVIWEADGSMLINESVHATSWSGVLPASGDYYIDVRSYSPMNAYYTLEVYISASESNAGNAVGIISGMLNYPEAVVPPMHIVAYNQSNGTWYWLGSAENDVGYTMVNIPVGIYTLVAYTRNGYVGGYASAGDGELIPFRVNAGRVAPADFTMWLDADNPLYPASDDPVAW